MGSPSDEEGRKGDEAQHEVTLTQRFGIGKYEVTQKLYETVMGANPSMFKNPNAPVGNVSWQDAMDFCEKLTQKHHEEGTLPLDHEYKLPTEAQWEYAARAGTTTRFSFGDDETLLGEYAWYSDNTDKPKPVGTLKPNNLGLHDMHGNVWEWCLDWYGDYGAGKQVDPEGPETGGLRVIRGGSWYNNAQYCRSAYRIQYQPDDRNHNLGFRVAAVQVLADPEPKPRDEVEEKPFELVWVEPGTFIMGSPPDEPGREEDEVQHEVELTQRFGIGKYEVTQKLYEAVMGGNPSLVKNPNAPVETVSWQEAMDFCERLTQTHHEKGTLPLDHEYKLPTEAQWEYAARAGTTTRFSFGDDEALSGDYAWYSANSTNPMPVGTLKSNNLGIHDMHGNVWEWCLDWYGDYGIGKQVDPKGPDTGPERVIRGGAWLNSAQSCRSAYRIPNQPDDRFHILGFRVAAVPVLEGR